MSSRKRTNRSIGEKNHTGKAATSNVDTADNDASDSPRLPLSALTSDDPSVLTTIFEPSKIKNFLYKVEPTMPRINASSLDLISTTATVLLKTLVEKAVLLEQKDRKDQTLQKDDHNKKKSVLITSNRLKSVVESTSGPSALDFLEDTFENFTDKDGKFLPHQQSAYVPRTTQKRKSKATDQSTTTLEGDKSTTTSIQATGAQAESGGTEKRQKTNHDYKGASSSLLHSNEFVNTTNSVERAIAQAASATEQYAPERIVEDDDDYD